jgi:hypothetical protein
MSTNNERVYSPNYSYTARGFRRQRQCFETLLENVSRGLFHIVRNSYPNVVCLTQSESFT